MRGIDMSTMAAGVADGKRQVIQANQRDRMREILDRNGVLPPEPEPDAPAPVSADLEQIAADEQEQMEGYHGLTTDDASGMKMFCESPALSIDRLIRQVSLDCPATLVLLASKSPCACPQILATH